MLIEPLNGLVQVCESAWDMMDDVRQVGPAECDQVTPSSLSGLHPGKSGGFCGPSDPPWRPAAGGGEVGGAEAAACSRMEEGRAPPLRVEPQCSSVINRSVIM